MNTIVMLIARIMAGGTLALALLVAAYFVFRPHPPKPPKTIGSMAELETYLKALTARGVPPGLSLAVVKDSEMVYSNGFGWADEPNQVPATADAVYHWWSMTKIPTAIAILQLHEQGRLDIDAPVAEYLPYFEPTYRTQSQPPITIRHLLNHSSGLRDAVPEILGWVHFQDDPPLNQTELLIEKLPDYDRLIFTPGERGQYTNVGYMVLGAVIEAVSGQSYEDYVVENIFCPLGMNLSNFVITDEMAAHEAAGSQHCVDLFTPLMIRDMDTLVRERGRMRLWFKRVYTDQTSPTGIIGPVVDHARLMIAYLNGGELDGCRILQPETVEMMTTESHAAPKHGRRLHGLGWSVHTDEQGLRWLSHGGGGPGFGAEMRLYPDESLGIVVIGNDTTFNKSAIFDLVTSLDW